MRKELGVRFLVLFFVIVFLALFFLIIEEKNLYVNCLRFSDGAKFAIIARNLVENRKYTTDFSFWGNNLFSTLGIPPVVPYLISFFMKIFGVNDFSVISFSFTFHIMLCVFVFLLTKRYSNTLVGIITSLAVFVNLNFLDYATSGASETLIAFEIVLVFYLFSLKKRFTDFFGILFLAIMYFSRPQAIIFIGALVFFLFLLRFGYKKGTVYLLGFGVIGIFIDKYLIYPLSFKYPVTPILMRGLQSIITYSSSLAVSDALRGATVNTLGISEIIKKTFYNLYNFYKAIPEIFNPYIFSLFLIGLFKKEENGNYLFFKLATVLMTFLTFLVTALTIPFYRYLHPIVPLIYVVGVITLYEIINYKVSATKQVMTNKFIFIVLVVFFAVGQTVGYFLLDLRFMNKRVNINKPPVYVVLSYKLKELTNPGDVVLTNLDTWGSWYGERKTVWFPLEPKQIINNKDGEIPFDAIYLTSYRIDDENYYMGGGWRQIFENPDKTERWTCDGCDKIAETFKLEGVYNINSSENYERQNSSAVLLTKKDE